jgi:hypothetical protein
MVAAIQALEDPASSFASYIQGLVICRIDNHPSAPAHAEIRQPANALPRVSAIGTSEYSLGPSESSRWFSKVRRDRS